MTRHRGRTAGAIVAAALLTVLTACGGTSESESGSDATPEQTAAFDSKIDALVKEASGPQTNRPPTEGPTAQSGKKLFVIPCAMLANGCAAAARAAEEAGKEIGWDVTLIDPAGDPTKQNNAVETAVAQKADGIFIASIDAKTISASLGRAKDAGTKVVCFACSDPDGQFDALVPDSPQDAYDSGYLAMAGLYEATDRDLKVVMVNGPEYGISTDKLGRQAGAKAFVDECREAGGKCELKAETDILLANFTTTVPGQVVSVLRQHPDANAMWAFADPVLAFIQPAVAQAGIDVKIGGIDPTGFNYDLIRDDKEHASVSPDLTWVGYAGIDNLNRLFAGEETVEQGVKGKLITPDNVPADGEFEGDFDVVPLYRTLWGLDG
jgi:ribose transport system substrate-binding protein